MKRNFSDYLVAIAVIACSAVLLAALTIALSDYRLKKPSRTLQIDYEDVTGIKVHSEVRYAGALAGRVIAMRHLSAAQRVAQENKKDAVRVTVALDDNLPPLPNDISATLSSDTLLSPKFVALSAGTPGTPTLANNATIEGHPAYGIEQITAAAGSLFENANKLIDNLTLTVSNANGTFSNLNGTISSVKNGLDEFLPKLSPLLDTVKLDMDELQKVILGLTGVEKNANSVFETAGNFLGSTDKQLQEQMRELRVILLNLKVVSTHAKALVDTLAEKPNRIIFSGKANKLTPEAQIIKSREPLPAKSQ